MNLNIIQKNFNEVTNQFHAKTLKGLEEVLSQELRDIGAEDVRPVNRGVNFSGSISMLYKANLYCRTALRILMPIANFKADDEDRLYKKIKAIDWSQYMTYKNSFAIDAVVFSELFTNSHYVELKIKDAIVDQFREQTSIRPTVDKKFADVRINVHLNGAYFMISLDSSGESLHKRGYRTHRHIAQLSEVLAAGMVLLAGYTGDQPFHNPMCGSGTIAMEAAMISAGIYPGFIERKYAFQNWPDYDELMFQRLKENMPDPLMPKFPISASDIDREAVRITKANARSLKLDDIIKVYSEDFLNIEEEQDQTLLIMNPPYGEKFKVDNIDQLYNGIGSTLKHKYPGTQAWIFTANLSAAKKIGLKPEKKITLFNAGLEGRYMNYKLFQGTRKEFKTGNYISK